MDERKGPTLSVEATLKISFVYDSNARSQRLLVDFEDRLTRPTGDRLLLMLEAVNKVKMGLMGEQYQLVPNLDGIITMEIK